MEKVIEKNFEKNNENCIEFLTGQKTATVTFCSQKWINKINKLAANNPDDVKIIATNKDGSICAHIPINYIKINSSRRPNMSEEQKQQGTERLAAWRYRKSL